MPFTFKIIYQIFGPLVSCLPILRNFMVFILFVVLSMDFRKGSKIFSRSNILNWTPPQFFIYWQTLISKGKLCVCICNVPPGHNLVRKHLLMWMKSCFKFRVSFPCIWSHNLLGIKTLPEINGAAKTVVLASCTMLLSTGNRTSFYHHQKFNVRNVRVVWEQSTVLDRDFKYNTWVFWILKTTRQGQGVWLLSNDDLH